MSEDIQGPSDNETDKVSRPKRSYTDAEKIIALLNVDANGGNVHRTAIAMDIPYATLAGWNDERKAGRFSLATIRDKHEKRGDLSTKMESVLHSLVESMAGKIPSATLSQTAVAAGILTDKLRIVRSQGLEPDPGAELCSLLGLQRSQLPENLQLSAGESIPDEFAAIIQHPAIETTQAPDGSFIPLIPDPQPDEDDKLLSDIPDDDESN